MNESGKRKVQDGAPLDFVPKRWEKHVYDEEGIINRHYYEMAALTELKNHIRSGDVSVVGSRLHKDFEEYLVPKDEWTTTNLKETRLADATPGITYHQMANAAQWRLYDDAINRAQATFSISWL